MRLFAPLALALLVACGGEEATTTEAAPEPAPAPAPAPEPAPEAEPEPAEFDAAAAFTTTCATCHGEGGAGDGVAGAALDPKPANFTDAAFHAERDDAAIAKAIKEGGPAVGKSPLMAPFGAQFDDSQIDGLVAHVRSFNPDGGGDAGAEGGDAPAEGEAAPAPGGDAPADGPAKGGKGGKAGKAGG